MGNYIDIKVTIWERLHFQDDTDMDSLVERLKNGETPDDLCGEEDGFSEMDILYDTEEHLSPEENGSSTIEVFKNDETIWTNSQ